MSMIKIGAPKISQSEKLNALNAAPRAVQTTTTKKQNEIPRNTLMTQAQKKEDEWIEHEVEKGLISYSAQYSDDTEVFR